MKISPRNRREDSCMFGVSSGVHKGWSRYIRSHTPSAKNLDIPFAAVLQREVRHFPGIEINRGTVGGTPRIAGTRIPVSLVLDAVQFYGDVSGAIKSYPDLTMDQVKQAISFSAAVLECRVGEKKP